MGTALVGILTGVVSAVSGQSKAESEAEVQAYLASHQAMIASNKLPVIMVGGMVMIALFAAARKKQ